jgi:hypothetical protein
VCYERLEPDAGRRREYPKARRRERTVFVEQRDDVGDGRESDEVEAAHDVGCSAPSSAEPSL